MIDLPAERVRRRLDPLACLAQPLEFGTPDDEFGIQRQCGQGRADVVRQGADHQRIHARQPLHLVEPFGHLALLVVQVAEDAHLGGEDVGIGRCVEEIDGTGIAAGESELFGSRGIDEVDHRQASRRIRAAQSCCEPEVVGAGELRVDDRQCDLVCGQQRECLMG